MFISKHKYTDLVQKVENLQNCVAALSESIASMRNSETDVLFGFAQDIDELKGAVAEFSDIADIAEEQKAAYIAQVKKDIGFQNMMNW